MGSIRQLPGNIDMELFHVGVSGELIWGGKHSGFIFICKSLRLGLGELCFQWQLSRIGMNREAGDQLAQVVNVVNK